MDLILGGTHATVLTCHELHDLVRERARGGSRPTVIASTNLDHLYHFGQHGHHEGLIESSPHDWIVTLDGTPLLRRAERLTGTPCERLAGSDVLPLLLAMAERERIAVGFLGGRPQMHAALRAVVRRELPALQVVGFWAPDRAALYDEARSRELASDVREAAPSLLVVSLGKPHQELWLAAHLERTGAHVALAFGAAADFLAGTTVRAPQWWQDHGLEWLYRLIQEPRRMWRRYLLNGPRSLWRLIRYSESSR